MGGCGVAPMKAHAANTLPRVEGSCVNEDMPQPRDVSGGKAPTVGLLRAPSSISPEVDA
jgi:hypothetical protein